MTLLRWLAQKSGLDIRSAEYSYGEDPVLAFRQYNSLHVYGRRRLQAFIR